MRQVFGKLSYESLTDFLYGTAPKPVKCKNGMVIGGGEVYPEINFTLPPMPIEEKNFQEIIAQYKEIVTGVLTRAAELHAPGVVVEVELLPPMTENPQWGLAVTETVLEIMDQFQQDQGLKSVLRLTPNDIREMRRPPLMRSGELWENMLATFTYAAKAGADFLAIESTGGKEVHDDALINADLAKVIFALGVLGARDMEFLWGHIVDIAQRYGSFASGDTACGFGNTAMVLAEQGMIPKAFAAVVRVATVSRSLVAYEMGAVGPSKDCAYEGPYMKAIAGVPIAMEGKSSACAHLSPVGNITAAVADLWSNESVQNVKLLGGMAPVVSIEQLIYDCRLLNQAQREGKDAALTLQKWLVNSDSAYDPQAYVLRPDVVYTISEKIVQEPEPFKRTKLAAQVAIDLLKNAVTTKEIRLAERELRWLDLMQYQLDEIPDDALKFWEQLKPSLDTSKFIPSEYGLE